MKVDRKIDFKRNADSNDSDDSEGYSERIKLGMWLLVSKTHKRIKTNQEKKSILIKKKLDFYFLLWDNSYVVCLRVIEPMNNL